MQLLHSIPALLIATVVMASPLPAQEESVAAINATLNELHDAASKADGARYFRLFTSDAVYIGTDASERWTIGQFRSFAQPFFS
jgi:hypothetical protein